MGQIRNNLVEKADNHYGLVGEILGKSNLRDLNVSSWQGSIVQHACPITIPALFLVEKDLNAIQAIELAQREYTKFKNKFLDGAIKQQIDVNDIPGSVDQVLKSVMLGKSSMSPWYEIGRAHV